MNEEQKKNLCDELQDQLNRFGPNEKVEIKLNQLNPPTIKAKRKTSPKNRHSQKNED